MNYHCPSCNEIIHDHTRKFCGICGNALPGGLLLRITQADALHKEKDRTRQGSTRRSSICFRPGCAPWWGSGTGAAALNWIAQPSNLETYWASWPERDSKTQRTCRLTHP